MRVRLASIILLFLLLGASYVYSVAGDDGCYQYRASSANYLVKDPSGDWLIDWTSATASGHYSCYTITHSGSSGRSRCNRDFSANIGTEADPNWCAEEGTYQYYIRVRAALGTDGENEIGNDQGNLPSCVNSNINTGWQDAYNVNWDGDQNDCECLGEEWISQASYCGSQGCSGGNCCGDDAGEDWDTGTDGANACCDGVVISDDTYCSAISQWVVDGTYCNDDVREPSSSSGTAISGDDIICGCDSSGVVCDTTDADNLADGICASDTCDADEVARVGAIYYSDCSDGAIAYGDECDSNVNSEGTTPTYIADGVCGGTSHNTCYTEYASDASSSISASSVFGTETEVCNDAEENGYYCDDVSDGSYDPGDQRCDVSPGDSMCRVCDFGTLTDEEGLCEEGCNAHSDCDELPPFGTDGTGWCYNTGGCEDYCTSYIRDADETGAVAGSSNNDACGGCSADTSGQRCDSDFDGTWDGVCAYDGSIWTCDSDEVAGDSSQLYGDCSLPEISDGEQCENNPGPDGYTPETLGGLCAGEHCCEDLYVDSNNNGAFDDGDCTCRAAYDGFKCDNGNTGGWNGICAKDDGGAWVCAEGHVYYDGTDFRTGVYDVSYDGHMCDADVDDNGFEQDGLTYGDQDCAQTPPLSCGFGAGSDCTNICSGATGYQCTSLMNSTTAFTQTGTCAQGNVCDETGHICNDDGVYYDDCSSCSLDASLDPLGDTCDSMPESGGNYAADGLCTIEGCDTDGDVCRDYATDQFHDDCGSCSQGSLCDSGATTSFASDGFCSQSDCFVVSPAASESYVDANNNLIFDDSGSLAEGCGNAATRHYRCANEPSDREWDGVCIEYDSWECDTSLVTCTFDQSTNFDEPSSCLDSELNATTSVNSDFDSSDILTSTIQLSTIAASEIKGSSIRNSIISGSTVYNAEVNGSTLTDSIVFNSQLCSGIEGSDVQISNNIIVSGGVKIGTKWYYSPTNLATVCTGSMASATGYMTFNRTAAADGESLAVYYVGAGTGYSATADLSTLGGGSDVSLVDDGTGADEEAGDGIYTGTLESIDTSDSDGLIEVTAEITSVSDTWTVAGGILIDNTAPSGSLSVHSTTGDEFKSASPTVILDALYSDDLGVDACRYANEDPANLASAAFDSCSQSLYWSLYNENGTRTVFLEIRDIAGNTVIVNDSIFMNTSYSNDITPPTRPTFSEVPAYSNDPSSLTYRWYNATDIEQALLFNQLYYDYWLCDATDCTVAHNVTSETEVVFDDLNLAHGGSYYLRVSAYNIEQLYSENATSGSTIIDLVDPSLPSVLPSINESEWYESIAFNFSATDALSGVASFSTSLSKNPSVLPDNVGDGNRSISLPSLPDGGPYYFRVRAIDRAGNVGPVENVSFNIDKSPPTVPQMINFEQNASEGSTLLFNWTQSTDAGIGLKHYEYEISRYSDFSNTVDAGTTQQRYVVLTNASDGAYYARVRAVDDLDHESVWSDELSGVLDVQPPEIIFSKPSGTILSLEPTLIVRTNEQALCTYQETGKPELVFDVTNLRTHEVKLFLGNETSYTYTIRCTDPVGNTVVDTVAFTVDTGLQADSLDLSETPSTLYAGQINILNFSVRDGSTVIGEIPASDFRIFVNNRELKLATGGYSISDLGSGEYELGFVAPNGTEATVTVSYAETGFQDSETYDIKELSVDTGCSANCSYVRTEKPEPSDRQTTQDYTVVIRRLLEDGVADYEMCPDSNDVLEVGDCIKIENLGEGKMCLAFVDDCGEDTVTLVIEE